MSTTDIHVLNVGAGSCTVIKSPSGRLSMIDINDGGELRSYEKEEIRKTKSLIEQVLFLMQEKKKLDDPIEWFTTNMDGELFRFVLSHPDRDHMSGIRRLFQGEISMLNFWDLRHTRTRKESDFSSDAGWRDWEWYQAFREDRQLDGVTWPKRLSPLRSDTQQFWAEDNVEILSPTSELITDCDDADVYNNASYVLRVRHGPTSSFLLASDVEEKAWNEMLASGVTLRANVFVASHHGRKSGYHLEAMKLIHPEVVIVSTGNLPPEHDGISLYRKHTQSVFSTRDHGTISVRMYDGGNVDIWAADGTSLTKLWDKA